MDIKSILLSFGLTLFDGGAAAGGADGGSAGNSNASGAGSQTTGGTLYGKQSEGQNTVPTEDKPIDKATAFKELIKGEYKDSFTDEVNRIVKDRLKNVKQANDFQEKAQPILDNLYVRYGVKGGDMEALAAAIDSDNAFLEDQAEKEGLTVEQYKHMKRMEADSARFHALQAQNEQQSRAAAQYQYWIAEAETLKGEYPAFDLNAECANKNFTDLLTRGIDMKTAYRIAHFDDLQAGAAQAAEKKVADSIRAGQSRPAENGTAAAQSGMVIKNDVSKLTRQDRLEIAKRVGRGEVIKF